MGWLCTLGSILVITCEFSKKIMWLVLFADLCKVPSPIETNILDLPYLGFSAGHIFLNVLNRINGKRSYHNFFTQTVFQFVFPSYLNSLHISVRVCQMQLLVSLLLIVLTIVCWVIRIVWRSMISLTVLEVRIFTSVLELLEKLISFFDERKKSWNYFDVASEP